MEKENKIDILNKLSNNEIMNSTSNLDHNSHRVYFELFKKLTQLNLNNLINQSII